MIGYCISFIVIIRVGKDMFSRKLNKLALAVLVISSVVSGIATVSYAQGIHQDNGREVDSSKSIPNDAYTTFITNNKEIIDSFSIAIQNPRINREISKVRQRKTSTIESWNAVKVAITKIDISQTVADRIVEILRHQKNKNESVRFLRFIRDTKLPDRPVSDNDTRKSIAEKSNQERTVQIDKHIDKLAATGMFPKEELDKKRSLLMNRLAITRQIGTVSTPMTAEEKAIAITTFNNAFRASRNSGDTTVSPELRALAVAARGEEFAARISRTVAATGAREASTLRNATTGNKTTTTVGRTPEEKAIAITTFNNAFRASRNNGDTTVSPELRALAVAARGEEFAARISRTVAATGAREAPTLRNTATTGNKTTTTVGRTAEEKAIAITTFNNAFRASRNNGDTTVSPELRALAVAARGEEFAARISKTVAATGAREAHTLRNTAADK